MLFKMQLGGLILVLALGCVLSHAGDNWRVIRQDKSQTLLSSSNGIIFIEPGKKTPTSDTPETRLLQLGQAIFPDGQLQPVDSLQQLVPNLVGQNFRVLRESYLPPLEEKLRVILYTDSLISVKFIGTTRTKDFNYLQANLDHLAQQFQETHRAPSKKLSETTMEP